MKNVEDYYPLSPMQQGMLFHSLVAPGSGMYHEQVSVSLRGELDVTAFSCAWERVADRHPVLRTSFVLEDLDDPVQVVHREHSLRWDRQDWRELPREQQVRRFADYLRTDREQGFEFSRPPLMRLALIQMADDVHRFLWSYHHSCLDGWSAPLVLKEVYECYEALRHGQPAGLEPRRPFRDYIKWLKRQDYSEAEQFWRGKLRGFTAPTPLYGDQTLGWPSGDRKDYDGLTVKLSETATASLQRFVRQHRLTLNTVIQGAWALLLSRHSGEDDIVFGATTAGRPTALESVETMIGVFINTVPVRVKLSASDLLPPWLQRLQSQFAELRQYEYAPLVQIQGWSEVPRGLFDSLVIFENFPTNGFVQVKSGSLKFGDFFYHTRIHYPLALMVVPDREMSLRIMYDGKRFDASTITRTLGHYRTLLESMVADPGRMLSELSLLTEEERHQLVVDWNDTGEEYPKEKCIHELFEAQARRVPDAVAVVFGSSGKSRGSANGLGTSEEQQLSYGELNDQAERVARGLRSMGVKAGEVVGICLERSVEMVVGLLGILKSGGAYVPIDPGYPAERIEFMIADSGMKVLVTQEELKGDVTRSGCRVVSVEELLSDGGIAAVPMVSEGAGPEDLAYVIYTSGSTGKPKGVEIRHRSLVNFLHSMKQRPGLTQQDKLLSVTTISFDIAALELFLPLTVGACVVVASRDETADAVFLMRQLEQPGVSVMQATPATWRMLVEAGWKGKKGLKVLCGGEALSVDLAKALLERSGSVWNLYGPTETTVWSTVWEVKSGFDRILIGRPIHNTQIYILDSHLQPVPVGVTGELYIGGEGVARGYLNRRELTAEKFVDDPYRRSGGAWLFRTGDLARYMADGHIECLGRIDHQVKIRGYRIEAGEIEEVLGEHPGVRQSVVVAREELGGGTTAKLGASKRLVAYVVRGGDQAAEAGQLREYLRGKLPEPMIPSAFVFLDALPLTPNGKVDRKALPEPELGSVGGEVEYVAPRTAVEQMIAQIWGELLGVERVGIHDNFFDLGGHSLLASRVISRIRDLLQVELPLRAFFEAGTLGGMAESVETIQWVWQSVEAPVGDNGAILEEGAV